MHPKRLLTLSVLTTFTFAALAALFLFMARAEAAPAAPSAATATGQFSAYLDGAQEVPPVETGATGVARFTLTDDDNLTYEVAVRDIISITAAHIHIGAVGVGGGVVHTLYDGTGLFDPDYPISGDLTLTDEQVDDLLAGNYYVNVHTDAYPAGEIRGQIGAAQTLAFGAMLSAADEVPANDSDATGQAFVTLNADMSQLYYRVLVADISGVTAAHFHQAPPGANGPVIFPIYTGGPPPFDEDNPVSGVITPTLSQVAALMAGDYYVNVHTSAHPPGEIRGQVNQAMTPQADYHALLWGGEENPPVDTEAVGVATFALSDDLSTVDYHVAVADIISITAAHLHTGWPGQNGGVAHTLYTGGPFDPDNPISGTLAFDAQSVLDLWSGFYYTNVHTSANPGGEIRGQVEGPSLFQADLDGAQENPPNGSEGTGRAVLALSGDATTLYYRVMVSDIEHITASHIHLGAVGVNGPVVFPLYTGTGMFDPTHPISGSVTLTHEDVLDLVAGDYYINVHTSHLPAGEIRGQVWPFDAPDHYEAWLDGDQEVPPVATDATGLAKFTLDEGRNTLHFRVDIDDIDNVVAAHIHKAPFGVNGPVIFPLFLGGPPPFDPDNPIGGGGMPGAEGLVDLLTGYYYTNVHSSDYPGGEIRGQIAPAATRVYLPVTIAQ